MTTKRKNRHGRTAQIITRTTLLLLSLAAATTCIRAQEMATLANGLDACAIDTGYYVSLENLNDLSNPNTTIPYDSIVDQGGVYTIRPSDGVFSANRRDLTTAFLSWNDSGYVIFQQGRTQTGTTPYDQGSPLDPWGEPYYLFNPLGLIRGDQGIITQELYGDQFDRYTIVSLGPDGVMSNDDLFYEFGPGITGTHLTSLRGDGVVQTSPPQAPVEYDVEAGTTVTLRGINFGAPAENKHVVFGDTVIQEVLDWTTREITVVIPETLTGTDTFRIQLGTSSTNGTTATITGSDTRVNDWQDY